MSGVSLKETEGFKRLTALFDDGEFTELDENLSGSVVSGFGKIRGVRCYAFSQNLSVNSGAIDQKHCQKIIKLYDLAVKTGCPIIGIYDSNGLSLGEPFESLSSYGSILKKSASVSGVIPQISVIAGACLGTSALMANTADIVIKTKYADYYLASSCSSSDIAVSDQGSADMIAEDFEEAVNDVKAVVEMLPENNLSPIPVLEYDDPVSADYDSVEAIADLGSLLELKKDDSHQLKTYLGTITGKTVGFIVSDGGYFSSSDADKAESLIRLCDAYQIPLITIADTKGYQKEDADLSLKALTKLSSAYASATNAKISLITKEAIGGAYIILASKGANADLVYAYENAVISPLETEASVAFLYGDQLANGADRNLLEEEYKRTTANAVNAASFGAIDSVIAPHQVREKMIAALDVLSGKRETTLPRKHSVK